MRIWVLLVMVVSLVFGSIADWEKIETLEKAWKKQKAKKLREKTIIEVTKLYIADFKDKYEEKYKKKFDNFSVELQWLTLKCYEIAKTHLNNPNEKINHKLVKWLYQFFENYNAENGKAEAFAHRLEKKVPDLKWTDILKVLI